MNTSLSQREQFLIGEMQSEQQALQHLNDRLQTVDSELSVLAPRREQFRLLGLICESLDQLDDMGAASLFWGEHALPEGYTEQIAASREQARQFNEKLDALQAEQASLLEAIEFRQGNLNELAYHLHEVRDAIKKAEFDFVIDRQARDEILFRAGILPWSTPEEDRRRQRKILLIALLAMFIIGVIPALWKLPPPDPNKKVEIPERLAKMVKEKAKPKPVPPPKKEELKKDEPKKDEQKVAKEQPKPEEIKKAREKAKNKGVLAHSNIFSDLTDDATLSNLGVDAKISGAKSFGGAASNGAAGSRALITAAGGSGGSAAVAAVSRGGVGSGNGNAISGNGVSVGSVSSDVAAAVGDARPVTEGIGPARTDEEIQIVFDRYKSALYRIYNRELRTNPSLRGKMVLELVIEPDGSVSSCRVKSTDLDSPSLSAQIVERVTKFNFGAKEGVPSTKILYPIDFLPAG